MYYFNQVLYKIIQTITVLVFTCKLFKKSDINMKHFLDLSIGLDQLHVSASENKNLKISSNRLSVSTWMKMYLYRYAKTFEERKCLRKSAISISEKFGYKNAVSKHGTFSKKFGSSKPYNFFLTTVYRLRQTFEQPYSLAFHEIIDYTEGEIVDSLYFTFKLDMLWLATEYMLSGQYPKMTVMYGILLDPSNKNQIPFDISIIKVPMPHKFTCHHSKISIFKYKNGDIRILIATANLRRSDWEQWTQGLWVSPILPPLPKDAADSDGESITHFKKDFIAYLHVYEQLEIKQWESVIRRINFSAIKVFFFSSVPGYHEDSAINLYGHKRLYNILQNHVSLPDNAKDWPIVAQSSSVGIFGQDYCRWMSNHIVRTMAKEKDKRIIHFPKTIFRFLYPTKKTYEKSFDVETGLTPLSYYKEQHSKQQWIEDCLYQWKFERSGRARSMPHCKSYTRISPDETEIAWFILTSANLSKAGWGKMVKGVHYIANYEAGVIFIPQIMINQSTFPIKKSDDLKVPVFLLPYDIPLCPYKSGMEIATLPGERSMADYTQEKEKQSETNIDEQEETDHFRKDERV